MSADTNVRMTLNDLESLTLTLTLTLTLSLLAHLRLDSRIAEYNNFKIQ